MTDDLVPTTPAEVAGDDPHVALARYLSGPNYEKYARFIFAILGAIPWVGSIFAASTALHAEKEQGTVNLLMYRWLEEHEHAYRRLEDTVHKIVERIEQIGPAAQQRLDDEKFLGLVRRAFQVWDEATSEEKREYVRRAVTNAAATKLCSDDLVRLFLQWIAQYDEVHFRVIKVIYKAPGSTRADIWDEIHGDDVRENSAEADLFKTDHARPKHRERDPAASRHDTRWSVSCAKARPHASAPEHGHGLGVRRRQAVRADGTRQPVRALRLERSRAASRPAELTRATSTRRSEAATRNPRRCEISSLARSRRHRENKADPEPVQTGLMDCTT